MTRPTTRPTGRQGAHGFSLIEMLAAITLMAVTALLISQALGFGAAASDRLTVRAAGLTERVVARRTLSRLVTRALPPGIAAFDAAAGRLGFARRAEGESDPGAWVLAELTVDGKALVLTECASDRPPGNEGTPLACATPRTERLALEFDAPVRLIYQARDGARAGRWPNQDRLPALLEIAGAVPPLVIPFRLGRRP